MLNGLPVEDLHGEILVVRGGFHSDPRVVAVFESWIRAHFHDVGLVSLSPELQLDERVHGAGVEDAAVVQILRREDLDGELGGREEGGLEK